MKYVNEKGLEKVIKKTKELLAIEREKTEELSNNINSVLNPFITSQGTDIILQNTGNARFKSIKITGNSYQEAIPTPMTSSEIKCVTDEVNLTINNNLETTDSNYKEQVLLFPLEQNQKLYKDSYLEDNGIHYKRKQIILDGTENWGKDTNTDDEVDYFYVFNTGITQDNVNTVICSHFTKTAGRLTEGFWATSIFCITINKEITGIVSSDTKEERIGKFKAWLAQQKEMEPLL